MTEYIDRKAVIDLITCRYENPEICTQEINSIPTADVALVRHGRWEFVEQQFYMGGFINILRCSECENRVDREYRFCPNCGAKMDLED